MKTSAQLIDVLGNSSLFRRYRRAYQGLTGLELALRPAEPNGSGTIWESEVNGTPLCQLMAAALPCALCRRLQRQRTRGAVSKPGVVSCICGLAESIVPVKLGARTVAYLRTGKAVVERNGGAPYHRALEEAARQGARLDEALARQACSRLPAISREKLRCSQLLLAEFAEHLSWRCNQLLIQQQSDEPPAITRARHYIGAHLAGELSLGTVARAVSMSPFYFCKQFKKATGLTFTEFLARHRIERSKMLLENRNSRVTEVAFESGFQSLTHFNRTFRRIVGESPSAYRGRLRQG